MYYVLGIDGGGTNTKAIAMNLEDKSTKSYTAKSSNILAGGEQNAKESISDIFTFLKNDGLYIKDCLAICIGLAGADRKYVEEKVIKIIRGLGHTGELIVTSDAKIALHSDIEKEGMTIIVGTGSIAMGIKDGKYYRVGGYGHIVGDEGSAYYIGLKIIKAVLDSYDGILKKTELTDVLLDDMNIKTEDEIVELVYKNKHDKTYIARRSILLERVKNDKIAKCIINDSVNFLFLYVKAMIKKLQLENINITMAGSVLEKNCDIREGLVKKIKEKYTTANVCLAKNTACFGALKLALEKIKEKKA